MAHPLRIVEGAVSTRPVEALGDFVTDGPQAIAADVEFDFGGLRKDVHVESDQPFTIKFNSAAVTGMTVAPGSWDWTDEFAEKAFVTFAVLTNFKMVANG